MLKRLKAGLAWMLICIPLIMAGCDGDTPTDKPDTRPDTDGTDDHGVVH